MDKNIDLTSPSVIEEDQNQPVYPPWKQPQNFSIDSIVVPPESKLGFTDFFILFIVIVVVVGAGYLCYKYRWLLTPAILIFFTVVATQFATTAMKNSLRNLAQSTPTRNSKVNPFVTDETRSKINKIIVERADYLSDAAGSTVEAYLSQVVANWAFLVLTFGNSVALHVHAYKNRSLLLFAIGGVVSHLLILFTAVIGATILFGKYPVEEFYDPYANKRERWWREYYSRFNKVVGLRIIFFFLYVITSIILAIPAEQLGRWSCWLQEHNNF